MEWHSLVIETKEEAIEAIADMLYSLEVKGIEIIDNKLSDSEKEKLIVDYIDDRIIPSDVVKIICYFSDQEDIDEKIELIKKGLENIAQFIDIGECSITLGTTSEEDWANNWKKYYKPFKVGSSIVVKPTWEEYQKENNEEIIIEIDPGMAFGCGTHETTSMCIEHIEKNIKKDDTVLDIGCGSGILSIVAAKLGAKKVTGIDLDKAAVKVSKENVELNRLEDTVSIYHGDLIGQENEKVDIAVANIMADVILILMEDIEKVLKKGGLFIASGIIRDRYPEIEKKLLEKGFSVLDKTDMSEWVAVTAQNQ